MLTSCPSCQRKLNVPDAAAGKKVRCPGCQTAFDVAAPAAAAPPPPPPAPAPAEPEDAAAGDPFQFGAPALVHGGGDLDVGEPEVVAGGTNAGGGYTVRQAGQALRAASLSLILTPVLIGGAVTLLAFAAGASRGRLADGLLAAAIAMSLSLCGPLVFAAPFVVLMHLGTRALRAGDRPGMVLAAGIAAGVAAGLFGLSLLGLAAVFVFAVFRGQFPVGPLLYAIPVLINFLLCLSAALLTIKAHKQRSAA